MGDAGDIERRAAETSEDAGEREDAAEGDRESAAAAPATPRASDGTRAEAESPVKSAASAPTLTSRIDGLKAEQTALLQQKQRLAKDLRNAERKRRRLKQKAKTLSDEDLVQLLALRQKPTSKSLCQSEAAPQAP